MHILFIGYGKTSQSVAKQLFQQQQQISTISLSKKTDPWAQHDQQDVHQLDLTGYAPIDFVYVLLSPKVPSIEAYQSIYLDSALPIIQALKSHPVKRIIVVSSTRVYGQNAGEEVNDDSAIQPSDAQGKVLYQMEQSYINAFAERCCIVRPSGIYGTSIARMQKLAVTTKNYPNLHWSNRIHIEDLSRFLSQMIHVEHPEKSYILTNNQPQLLHETIQWFQKKMNVPLLSVATNKVTGKKLYATHMQQLGFQLQHPNCYIDYAALLAQIKKDG